MRLIPGKTKVQIELFKGVTLTDVIIGFVAALLVGVVLLSTLPGQIYIVAVIVFLTAILLLRLDSEPNYIFVLSILTHLVTRHNFKRKTTDREMLDPENAGEAPKVETEEEKKARLRAEKEEYLKEEKILKDKNTTKEEADAIWLKRANRSAENKARKQNASAADMSEIIGFTGIKDGFIEYNGEYFGAVIEIPPVEFRFFSEGRRQYSIESGLGMIFRVLDGRYSANIIKIERPVLYDDYINLEKDKVDELRKTYEEGFITEEEFKARAEILAGRMDELNDICFNQKVLQPYYYLVIYDSDTTQLTNTVNTALDSLKAGEINGRRLFDRDLAIFLKYTNSIDFDERDIEKLAPDQYVAWAMPESVEINHKYARINGVVAHTMKVVNYPSLVGDAWMASMMSIPCTKVMVKCRPLDKNKSISVIDRSLQELRVQYYSTNVDSKRIEYQTHIESLQLLLSTLQSDSESLLEVSVYITAYDIAATKALMGEAGDKFESAYPPVDNFKRLIKRTFQEQTMRLNNMDFDQTKGFIGSQVTAWDPLRNNGRGMPSNTVAAMYPWIYAHVKDQKGVKLGKADSAPVFVDFYRRDSERVNSNLVILGKSGSGKSYATKTILANLAADDSKIFILDPENEYSELAHNLHGKFINVGNAKHGRLNPFHIITALDDDEAEDIQASSSYATHLQFLEEFMKQILPDCDKDAMEYLNSMIDRMYLNKGITDNTDLSRLKPEDYPTFDDLYDTILSEFQSSDNEYIKTMLRTLMNYIQKFSGSGRNAVIWNGPSSITTEENFTVFNFQSLLANRNNTVANAQMLLVLKYIDNEIIKNRDYNLKYGLNRKIIVVIDEAHVFIDTKYPIALDFMFQLAKRIRKYNGMQIVITQNIKDFVGSEEIARKSTAIINACQYSFIFSLSPNDMDDLCKLYDKSGGINENEQEQIVNAPRGQVFAIMSPQSRTTFNVEAAKEIVEMFQQPDHLNSYFAGDEGEKAWIDFLGDSKEKRVPNRLRELTESDVSDVGTKRKHVTFLEITEDELRNGGAAPQDAPAAIREIPPISPKEPTVNVGIAAKIPGIPAVSYGTGLASGETTLSDDLSLEDMLEENETEETNELSAETANVTDLPEELFDLFDDMSTDEELLFPIAGVGEEADDILLNTMFASLDDTEEESEDEVQAEITSDDVPDVFLDFTEEENGTETDELPDDLLSSEKNDEANENDNLDTLFDFLLDDGKEKESVSRAADFFAAEPDEDEDGVTVPNDLTAASSAQTQAPTIGAQAPLIGAQAPAAGTNITAASGSSGVESALSETAALLGNILNRFSYDTMVEEIRRAVRETVGTEMSAQNRTPVPDIADDDDDELDFESLLGPSDDESDGDDLSLGGLFGLDSGEDEPLLGDLFSLDEDDEDETTGESSQQPSGGVALGNIFEAAAQAGVQSFDVSQTLSADANAANRVSAIETMEEKGEAVLEVTLEDLIIYNENLLKSKKTA